MSAPIPRICLACHGQPESPPNLEDLHALADEHSPEILSSEDCRFHRLWYETDPAFLPLPPEGEVPPWWVRGNYESIRGRALPLRIQVDQADVELNLLPRSSSEVPLENLLGENAPDPDYFELGTDSESSLQIFLNVQDGEILLRNQEFLRSTQILLDGPGTWNVEDPGLRIDEDGMVHVDFDVPYEWWNDGHHDIILQQSIPEQLGGWAYQAMDFLIGDWIGSLVDFLGLPNLNANAGLPGLPESIQFEALLDGLITYFQNREPEPDSEQEPLWRRLIQHLRPGSEIHTGQVEIGDLFYSGMVDLGPSTFELNARINEEGNLDLDIPSFHVNFDPMGYGRGVAQGNPSVTWEDGWISLVPGETITGTFQVDARALEFHAPLDLELEFTLPHLGRVRFSGRLEVQSEVIFTTEGPNLVPGTTYLHLSEGEMELLGEPSPQAAAMVQALAPAQGGLPLLRNLELELGDGEAMQGMIAPLRQMASPDGPVRWEYQVSAMLGDQAMHSHGQLGLPQNQGGVYDFAGALNQNNGEFFLDLPGMLENLLLEWGLDHDEDRTQFSGAITFDRLSLDQDQGLPQALWLRDGNARMDLEYRELEDGRLQFRIPNLTASANPRGSGGGILRGPLGIAQDPDRAILVTVDPENRNLQVSDAQLAVHAYQVGALPEGVRSYLDPNIRTLGVDGRLRANFRFYFPEDRSRWHGRGLVQLRGDSRGDVYWYDVHGRRVGPPLIRNTRWNWRRVDSINVERGYALGAFSMGFLVNPQALMRFSEMTPVEGARVLVDERGRELNPFEMSLTMDYDNQPATIEGFINRIVDYLNTLHRREGGSSK